jgi:hypothetical protein
MVSLLEQLAFGKVDEGKMIVLHDSLQLAHECNLDSFYGSVV